MNESEFVLFTNVNWENVWHVLKQKYFEPLKESGINLNFRGIDNTSSKEELIAVRVEFFKSRRMVEVQLIPNMPLADPKAKLEQDYRVDFMRWMGSHALESVNRQSAFKIFIFKKLGLSFDGKKVMEPQKQLEIA